MNTFLKWFTRIVGVIAVLVLVALAAGWYLVSRSLPNYEGTYSMDGLEGPVTIVRDANAVPHIRASSDHDAFYALGLVHAQDRLWQMELSRRAAQGRLSEVLGAWRTGQEVRPSVCSSRLLDRPAASIQIEQTDGLG